MIALDIASPVYTSNGRQMPFHETPIQRVARAAFMKQRTGDKRVAAWVDGQRQQSISLWAGATATNAGSHRITHREPYIRQPHLFSIQEDRFSDSLCYSVPYIHPDDEEPFIFYSTKPAQLDSTSRAPSLVVSKPSPRRGKHMRHRRQLSGQFFGLDVIPEEICVEG